MIKTLLYGSLSVLLCSLVACSQFDNLEDLDGAEYNAEFAVPLVDTEFSLRDLLKNFEENSSLTIDPDGVIRFKYSGDVLTKTSEEVFEEINRVLALVPIFLTSDRIALPFASPDGLDIDRMELKSGKFTYALQNLHSQPVFVTLRIPEVVQNGTPLTITTSIPAFSGSGTPPSVGNLFSPLQLGGYTILPAANDSIYVEYTATDPMGNNVLLGTSSGILIQDLKFSYAEGYLGNQLYEGGRDTIDIDFFDNWIRGDVYFEDPKITLNFENSFGIPTRSVVNLFNVLTVRQEVLPLESSFINSGVDFPYPGLDEVGQVKQSAFVFTKDNSNIATILGAGPVQLDYDVDAFTNPDMNTSIRGFITDSSYYKVRVDVELPLFGRAFDFVVSDSFAVDFSKYDVISAAEFKMVADNYLPLSVDVQAYFRDENGVVLDSMLDNRQRVIAAAPTNADGIATGFEQKITFAGFDAVRFDRIRFAKDIYLVTAFSTYNDGDRSVKVLADQAVKVRMGVKVETGSK